MRYWRREIMIQKELNQIIAQGEGYKIEFKENLNTDFKKELVAFANASGGKIFIGIGDDGSIPGVAINNQFRSKVQDFASRCDPPVHIDLEEFNNILLVTVKEGFNKPYRCTSGFYIRVGANSQKLKTNEIIDFIQHEGRVRFDEQWQLNTDFTEHFDQLLLDNYLTKGEIAPLLEPENILMNLSVVKQNDGVPIFNNAGILLFTTNPTRVLPQSYISCVSYKDTDKADYLDQKDFNNDIIHNIENTLQFLERHLNKSARIEGIQREDILEIPMVALRESVINAVVHRNYLETGARVMVEVFPDRVEISNPGGLPRGLNESNFGKISLARNPLIASLLQRVGYIEKLGTGISRMRKVMAEAGLQKPQFSFNGFFRVAFIREYQETGEAVKRFGVKFGVKFGAKFGVSLKRSKRLIQIMDVLYHKEPFSVDEFAKIHELSIRQIEKDMQFLTNNDLIVFEGVPKTGKYVCTDFGDTYMASLTEQS